MFDAVIKQFIHVSMTLTVPGDISKA